VSQSGAMITWERAFGGCECFLVPKHDRQVDKLLNLHALAAGVFDGSFGCVS